VIETYTRHSPSSLNLYATCPSAFCLERIMGIKQLVGAPAHRGVAVEYGVTHGLLDPGASLTDCTSRAQDRYRVLMALSGDHRREEYELAIYDMVKQALEALRPYGVPTSTQDFVEWRPEGLLLPIVGYLDYAWDQHGVIVDLKTTERLPSEIRVSHARQVALYCKSGDIKGVLTYVTPKKYASYELENISQHREALRRIALGVESLLALSNDVEYFKRLFVPDLEHYMWNTPEMRALAWEHWRI
jgi:hypothetical protein